MGWIFFFLLAFPPPSQLPPPSSTKGLMHPSLASNLLVIENALVYEFRYVQASAGV